MNLKGTCSGKYVTCVSQVPKTTLRFSNWLEGRTDSKSYYSENNQPQSAKGKGSWSEVQGRLGTGFQGFPSCAVTQAECNSLSTIAIPPVR